MKLKKHRARRRGPKYWIVAIGAMGMLVAYCPRNSHNIVLGKVRDDSKITATAPQQQMAFDIPADTLESVLLVFQRTSGLQVVIPNEAMRSLPSPGVNGRHTSEQALREILRGTGVHACPLELHG